jgi:hypothetical protein
LFVISGTHSCEKESGNTKLSMLEIQNQCIEGKKIEIQTNYVQNETQTPVHLF